MAVMLEELQSRLKARMASSKPAREARLIGPLDLNRAILI